jgi:hypothetical protein
MKQFGYLCAAFALTFKLNHLAGSGQQLETLPAAWFIFNTPGQRTTETGREKVTAPVMPVTIIGQRFCQLRGSLIGGHCPLIIVQMFYYNKTKLSLFTSHPLPLLSFKERRGTVFLRGA